MTRRLMLAALALFAFLALESCGVNRVAGPDASVLRTASALKVRQGKKGQLTPTPGEVPNPDQGGDNEQPVEINHGH